MCNTTVASGFSRKNVEACEFALFTGLSAGSVDAPLQAAVEEETHRGGSRHSISRRYSASSVASRSADHPSSARMIAAAAGAASEP